jgi:hypothetical protein
MFILAESIDTDTMRTKTLNKHSNKTLPAESGSVRCTPLPDPGTVNPDAGGASYMTYADQIKSPKWQKKRLEILERDKFTCQWCGSKDEKLNVHHYFYFKDCDIWDYEDYFLITVCDECHEWFHIQNDILKTLLSHMFTNNNICKVVDLMMEFRTDNDFFLKCYKLAEKRKSIRYKDLDF